MNCECGRKLEKYNDDGLCWACFADKRNKEIDEKYCRTDKLHTGWMCPKCGYVWAIWVDGCSNCNQPTYKITTTDSTETDHANQNKHGNTTIHP